jgi:nitrate/nitrite-specific signal transduction histidine kinase
MLLKVNNAEYQKARKNGFTGSFAEFAETCNRTNSELLNKRELLSPRQYFNDLGGNLVVNQEVNMDGLPKEFKAVLNEFNKNTEAIVDQIKEKEEKKEILGLSYPVFGVFSFFAVVFAAIALYGYYERKKEAKKHY